MSPEVELFILGASVPPSERASCSRPPSWVALALCDVGEVAVCQNRMI